MIRGISIPPVRGTFGFATHARQTGAIAWTSFWAIAKSPAGMVLTTVVMLLVLLVPVFVKLKGVSLLPTTALVLSKLTGPVADNPRLPWVLIPLLIIYWAGELVWRERDAGMGEIADATPVREWVLVLGKFLGLALVLVGWMALLIAAGVLVQVRMGYFAFELGLYLRILFGLQLVDYLIFALLVLVVHAVVNQKQIGYLAALVAYGVILFPSFLGIKHHLLIYGSSPRWSYSVVSGFGPSLGPWLWFKLYWAGWAVLLAVAARLLWPRGPEPSWGPRLRLARRRFTRGTAVVAATAAALILVLGGFIFYNTNVLHANVTTAGLDPAERVRFLNLLSELGEHSVVLLSAHIVEDVSELCTRMAIIDQGEILLEAEPLRAIDDLRGRIWRRMIAKTELAALEREHLVISTKLLAGRTVVHVYNNTAPGPGFEPTEPDLEDVYFCAMGRHLSSTRAA